MGMPTSKMSSVFGSYVAQISTYTFHQLARQEVMKVTGNVLKKNHDSIRKYAQSENKVLRLFYLYSLIFHVFSILI